LNFSIRICICLRATEPGDRRTNDDMFTFAKSNKKLWIIYHIHWIRLHHCEGLVAYSDSFHPKFRTLVSRYWYWS